MTSRLECDTLNFVKIVLLLFVVCATLFPKSDTEMLYSRVINANSLSV